MRREWDKGSLEAVGLLVEGRLGGAVPATLAASMVKEASSSRRRPRGRRLASWASTAVPPSLVWARVTICSASWAIWTAIERRGFFSSAGVASRPPLLTTLERLTRRSPANPAAALAAGASMRPAMPRASRSSVAARTRELWVCFWDAPSSSRRRCRRESEGDGGLGAEGFVAGAIDQGGDDCLG